MEVDLIVFLASFCYVRSIIKKTANSCIVVKGVIAPQLMLFPKADGLVLSSSSLRILSL